MRVGHFEKVPNKMLDPISHNQIYFSLNGPHDQFQSQESAYTEHSQAFEEPFRFMGWIEMHLGNRLPFLPHSTSAPSRTGCQRDVHLGVQLATPKEYDGPKMLVDLVPRSVSYERWKYLIGIAYSIRTRWSLRGARTRKETFDSPVVHGSFVSVEETSINWAQKRP